MEKVKGILVAVALWIGLITTGDAEWNTVAYKPPGGVITMDVVKNDGYKGGGTWLCESLHSCYIKVLEAEYRGATLYCETITLKRDGNVIWHRDYNDPYWIRVQKLKSHDAIWHN